VLSVSVLLFGYVWAGHYLEKVTLTESFVYSGRAQIVSLRFVKPPKQRVILKLQEGEKAGLYLQAYTYDWSYDNGTHVNIQATIEPSRYPSDRGRHVIGQSNNVEVSEKIKEPDGLFLFRSYMQSRIGATLPEPYASLALGLITGTNDDFDSSFKEDLQRTGTTHIVAVSGYNLTIVALLLQRLGQRKNRFVGFALALSGIAFYVVLAGANPSILRGAVIAFLSLWATVAGRITHRLPLVLMSAVLLSLITPLGMVYSLSWQLSFLAFIGILFINPLISPPLRGRGGNIGAMLGETLSAEVMVLPLILYKFGIFSLIAPLKIEGFAPANTT
jgi:ComEC/Rec2-related protein